MESIDISGHFTVKLIRNNEIIQVAESQNKILRSGIFWLLGGGSGNSFVQISNLDIIKVGSSSESTDYLQTELYELLGTGDHRTKEVLPNLKEFQYGFTNYFPPGFATGNWREIGASCSGPFISLFNRAVFSEDIIKDEVTSAYASVVFTIKRSIND